MQLHFKHCIRAVSRDLPGSIKSASAVVGPVHDPSCRRASLRGTSSSVSSLYSLPPPVRISLLFPRRRSFGDHSPGVVKGPSLLFLCSSHGCIPGTHSRMLASSGCLPCDFSACWGTWVRSLGMFGEGGRREVGNWGEEGVSVSSVSRRSFVILPSSLRAVDWVEEG